MLRTRALLLLGLGVVSATLFIACGSGSSTQGGGDGSTPIPGAVAEEQNPPGDIPDDQVFVPYRSDTGGYTLDVPEGWARAASGSNVKFADKLHIIDVEVTSQSTAPTVATAEANDVPTLQAQVDAFEKVSVKSADLPAGKAVFIRYRANSAPDTVTGKKVRLEVDRYELFKDGKVATISLSAPAGSDNVDVWNQISKSFKWN